MIIRKATPSVRLCSVLRGRRLTRDGAGRFGVKELGPHRELAFTVEWPSARRVRGK